MLGKVHAGIEDFLVLRVSQLGHGARVIQTEDVETTLLSSTRVCCYSDVEIVLAVIIKGLGHCADHTILERERSATYGDTRLRMCHQPVSDGLLEMALWPVRTEGSPAGGTVVTGQRPLIDSRPLKDVALRAHIDGIYHDFTRDRAQELIRNCDYRRRRHLRLLITRFSLAGLYFIKNIGQFFYNNVKLIFIQDTGT